VVARGVALGAKYYVGGMVDSGKGLVDGGMEVGRWLFGC
jgi:hypothetical protein